MEKQIVVLGAGYAGLPAAKLAARRTGGRVTLVNASDRFVERVRLHQLGSGQELRDRPLKELLTGTGVRLVVDRADRIDTENRTVHLAADPEPLHYDILIYALGSGPDLASVPGAAEHAHGVTSQEQAERLLKRLPETRSVAVVGGGLTGIEAAAEIAESHPGLDVRLVTAGRLGAALSRIGTAHLRRTFARLGVTVTERAPVAEVRADGPVLASGEHIPADTTVWTTGFSVPDLARRAGIEVAEDGRIAVDATMRSLSHPEVYAAGDAAALVSGDGKRLRMACATGIPSAQHAVRSIAARENGRQARPLRFAFFQQCISLGRQDGLIQFVHTDDSPRERILTGRAAVLYKEAIVRGAAYVMRRPGIPASL
ncbi:NAD(P)/FAD-dependent oxidoreductase [Nocardiopsis composta]|uniref:NADH dehydrogenase FAD-containing subunit n=1 Tax=Nocardiopsis composta TaxID=157465 RepID=A0A7W8QJ41_9ACTN|nr:FAD-dependent oxidoreductase [Nocardiopsis composta]MBB5430416.1 NADH dehydrogenase FAD-containing subunit [Nocardiopsis composta]